MSSSELGVAIKSQDTMEFVNDAAVTFVWSALAVGAAAYAIQTAAPGTSMLAKQAVLSATATVGGIALKNTTPRLALGLTGMGIAGVIGVTLCALTNCEPRQNPAARVFSAPMG